jgi:bifunctional non-homologous end joining protein LigD
LSDKRHSEKSAARPEFALRRERVNLSCAVAPGLYPRQLGKPTYGNLFFDFPMSSFVVPPAAMRAEIPHPLRPQIVSSGAEPPEGEGWLHEVKHDGHRLLAVVVGDKLELVSRNGHDRTALFREPFRPLIAAGLPPLVLDGEIAAPDDRGVTHIDALSEALRLRRPDHLAYFAFDLLYLDGHDLRGCPIEDRKALLRDLVGAAGGPRLVAVDHITGSGRQLFEAVRQLGAEGIVSKRAGSPYRGGIGRDWLKAKVSETAAFVITGFVEREAIAVAELRDGVLMPAGLVKFGLAGKDLWRRLDPLRAGSASRAGVVPVRPELVAAIRYFGRYRAGWIRDGVLLSVS